MPRLQRTKSKSGYYHVMLRGNERKNIFLDDEDKLRFIETIHQMKQGERFFLYTFCLMDNHVHIMMSEGFDDIAKAIKRIAVSYVFYFNKKYRRIGHLFQDRYKSEVVETDGYVLSLARYIHQNPVKANIVKLPGEYKWSSYNSYLDECNYMSKVLDRNEVLGILSNYSKNAETLFIEYMNKENEDSFLDIAEEEEVMDINEAKKLYEKLLEQRGIKVQDGKKTQIPDDLIRELKLLTKLSIRGIASVTNMNKDKVNRVLRDRQ